VFDAMRDHEGGLWFATLEGGIARLSPQWQNFALFRNDPGNPSSLQVNHVKGLAADASGAIWVVNSTGGIDRFDPATDRVEHLGERLQAPDRSLWSVLPDRNGQVWVGSTNALRVFDLRSAKFQDLPFDAKRRDALAPGLVFHIIQADSGAIWVNSFGAALHRIDPLTHAIERFDANNAGLRNAEVDQIGFDREGNLLAASAAGLDRFDATMQRFSPVPGAPTARVLEFAFVADATVWLHLPGALEHYRWDATGLHLLDRVDTKSGWPALTVGGMQVDSSGAVWVSSPRGLWRFDPATRAVRVFDAHDGLGSLEFTRMPLVKRRDGSIFGGTEAAGIVGFVPEQVAENATPPLLAPIEAVVRRNGHDIALDTATNLVDLRWDDRDLRIHAHALSYANPLGNRYQWKLGGLDSGWIDTGNHGEREFAQLPPGRHHLNLRAANASGVWTQATPILFEQASPPWATRWAYAAYVLAMVLAAWLVLQSYRKRLKRRHALELAEQQRRFAEQASAAKSDFLATMGHEIRTPMTGVLGMTELLLGTTLDAKQRGYAEAIQTSGNMMLRLVNDSLDLARIEAGKLELEDAGVDLHALVGEIAALAQTLAQRKGLVFTHSIAADAPRWVRGDAVRIKQIFLNLVNNAIKFTERGSVAFDLARAPSGATQFAVRDTGPGIAESTRQRLFERFEQANGTQRRYGGSGLGLAICRELVARMGGTIELESGVGEGSRFVVTLPLAQMSDAEQPDPAAAPSPAFVKPAAGIRARSLRILLVEDDATVAAVISGLLEAQGHRVRHVAQGLAALSESGIEPFDVALLDLDLHGIDGLALARALRASEAAENRPRLPLIGVSARSAGDEEALCLAAGMDRFLRKPVTSALLAAALEQVVADKG
jgi:signal transduction histidine kinase/CheY-like chemotaxis protein/streptogramin lyase